MQTDGISFPAKAHHALCPLPGPPRIAVCAAGILRLGGGCQGGIRGKTAGQEGGCGWYAPGPLPALPPMCTCCQLECQRLPPALCFLHLWVPVTGAGAVFELPQPEVDAGPVFVLGCELSLQTSPDEVTDHSLGILVNQKRGSDPCRRAVRCLLSHDYCPFGGNVTTFPSVARHQGKHVYDNGNNRTPRRPPPCSGPCCAAWCRQPRQAGSHPCSSIAHP